MLTEHPVIIESNEKLVLTAEAGGMGWDKAKNGEFGFRIIAKIDDTFHILGCAANILKAPMPLVQANESQRKMQNKPQ